MQQNKSTVWKCKTDVTQHIRDVTSSLWNSPVQGVEKKKKTEKKRLTQKLDQPFTMIFFLHFSWKCLYILSLELPVYNIIFILAHCIVFNDNNDSLINEKC